MPGPDDADSILETALADHAAGRLDRAEAGYRRVLEEDAEDLDALSLLGLILQDRGDFAESLALLRRALAIDPDFPEALTNLARVLRFTRQPAEAAEAAARAIALDPDLGEAHLQRGHAQLDGGDAAAAADSLRRATELMPDSPDAWLQRGIALLRQADHAAAAPALETAHRLRPDRADTLVHLAAAQVGLGHAAEAVAAARQAVALAPDDPLAQGQLAAALILRGDPVAAIAACDRALALLPDRLDVLTMLAAAQIQTGAFDAAEATLHRVLALDPDSMDARENLIAIRRGRDDPQERALLRRVLDDPAEPVRRRVQAGYSLATALDHAGDDNAAFAAMAAANRIAYADIGAETAAALDPRPLVSSLIATIRADRLAATQGWGDPSELPVFVVGLPRSGTTLVEQIMASHPLVAGAGELPDIPDIIRRLDGDAPHPAPDDWDPAAVRREAAAYLDRLRTIGGDAVRVINKTPGNLRFLGHIATLFPNARVVVCRRDPRDVGLSCFFQSFKDPRMAWSFDQVAIATQAQEAERLLDHWRLVRPLRMLEVGYEDLVANLETEGRRLIDFLGLDWDPACLDFHRTDRPVATASLWQVRQPLYGSSVGRWRRYQRQLLPMLAAMAGLVPLPDPMDWDALAADAETAFAVAVSHHRAGRLEFAAPAYQALARLRPDDPTLLHLWGLLLLDNAEPARAAATIRQAVELRAAAPADATGLHTPQVRSDPATLHADLARALRAAGDEAAALDAARQAIAADPDLADAHVQFGCTLLMQRDHAAAVEPLRKAVALDPHSLEAHMALATALAMAQQHADAADEWQEALALLPDDPDLRMGLAQALAELERFGEALELCQETDLRVPGHPRVRFVLAFVHMRAGNAATAAEICRQELERHPDWLPLWLMLANAEAMQGRFDAAAEAYRGALAQNPESADALNGLVFIGQSLDSAVSQQAARTVLDDVSRRATDRIASGFALGRDLDRSGAYEEAFAAYAAANALMRAEHGRRGFAFDREKFQGIVDTLIAYTTAPVFQATAGWGDPSDLPVFVVGMPRSGTTLVEQIMASHPQVFGGGERKDILTIALALGEGQALRPAHTWDRGALRLETRAHIQQLRALGGDALRFIDKLPDNVLSLGQIAVLFPNARVVVCRRDLRDVGLSCFFQYFHDDTLSWSDDLADIGFRAAQVERLVAHWRTVLPLRMIEIQYETLVGNLERESRRLIDFLGLDWDPACLAFHETQRTVQTASQWQVRQPLYDSSVGRWRHYRPHLGPLLTALAGVLPPEDAVP
jgi:tetratricopeptide (TPR) repeat protein